MTKKLRRCAAASVSIATCCHLVGCGTSQRTTYHELRAIPPSSMTEKPCERPLAITAFDIPEVLERAEVPRELSPGQFEVQEFQQWAGPFKQMARKTLARDVAARLKPGCMDVPGMPVQKGSTAIAITLISYRTRGDVIEMSATWSLKPTVPSESDAPWIYHSITLSTLGGDGKASSTVDGFDHLLAQLSDRIVDSLPTSPIEHAP